MMLSYFVEGIASLLAERKLEVTRFVLSMRLLGSHAGI